MAVANPTASFSKDPDAVLDYTLDWSSWLNSAGGDVIATSVWTVPAGIATVGNTNSGNQTTVWLSGGTAGQSYAVSNRITTAGGRTEDRTIQINVVDR